MEPNEKGSEEKQFDVGKKLSDRILRKKSNIPRKTFKSSFIRLLRNSELYLRNPIYYTDFPMYYAEFPKVLFRILHVLCRSSDKTMSFLYESLSSIIPVHDNLFNNKQPL